MAISVTVSLLDNTSRIAAADDTVCTTADGGCEPELDRHKLSKYVSNQEGVIERTHRFI